MTKYFKAVSILLFSSYFWYYARTYTEWHFIDNVNLIFHEAGHTIFSFFGEFTSILMGSGFQILFPLFFAVYFYFKGQKISAALTLLWVGTNILNVSLYARDSIVMVLPLLGGDNVIHDWNYILTSLGILRYTYTVASALYTIGIITMLLGVLLALYFATKDETEKPIYF